MAGSASNHQRRFQLVDALNAEWDRLVEESRGLPYRWRGRQPALRDCADLADVLPAIRADPDVVLGALLCEAAQGDTVAARAVLQAMLGKVVRMALRDPWGGVDDYVSALWCRIRRYPLERRPAKIAANLALDTLKDVTAARSAGLAELVTPWPPEDQLELLLSRRQRRLEPDEPEVSGRTLLQAALRLNLIDARACAILHSVYVEGLASSEAATRHTMSPEMVRYYCSRAVRRLRRNAEQLADAA